MAPPNTTSLELLTEHLGYPPIALIDDIINAVNGIMYKCTQAIETYLIEKEEQRIELLNKHKTDDDNDDILMASDEVREKLSTNEIEIGTAKLETLLESSIDKNFDKFELYALRNILTIPNDLSNEGYFKLSHFKNVSLDKDSDAKSVQIDLQINQLFKDITNQIYLRKFLQSNLKKSKNLIKLLKIYKESITFLSNDELINDLSPLKETFYYLISQTNDLYDQIMDLNKLFISNPISVDNQRDKYIKTETFKLLKVLNLVDDKPKISKLLQNLDNVDLTNPDLQKALNEKFGI